MATSSITSTGLSNTYAAQIEALVNQYKLTLNKPVEALNTKKSTLNSLKTTYSTLKTKLSSLQTTLESLALTGSSSKLNLSTVTSSDTSVVSVTSDGSPSIGNYNIFVNRLAKPDKIVSTKISKNETNLVSSGEYKFKININSKDYEISLKITDTSSSQAILKSIASAINSSSAKSLVGASVVNESSTFSRLMISSKSTGSDNSIKLSDESGKLLKNLGFFGKNGNSDSRTVKNGNFGGYYESSIDNLNASFLVDGTEYIKSSNTISDVLDGVTINLRAPQKQSDQEVSITTELDKTTIKTNLDNFIKNYNDIITLLNQKLKVSDGVRSDLSGDTTLMTLRSNLRSMISGQVSSTTDSTTSFLTQLGIKINSDYTIQWDDTDKLTSLLETDSTLVSDLFNTTNGIANKLLNVIKPFTKTNGSLDNKSELATNQIKQIDERLVTTQAQIDKKAESLRKQYENLITTINKLNQQQSTMQSIMSSSSGTTFY